MTIPQKFVVCKGTSGMGNRILAACTAILYGEISNRKVVIDWRDNSYSDNNKENAFPTYFNCPTSYPIESLPVTNSIFPGLWRGNLDKSLGGLRSEMNIKSLSEISFDSSNIDYLEEIIVFCAYTHKIRSLQPLFTGKFEYLSKMTIPEILSSVLNSKLQLVENIQNSISHYKQANFSSHTIGVHIRYTDIKVPLAKIIDKIESLANAEPDSTVFLATDSQVVVEHLKERFSKVITAEKWFPPKGERMHQNWDNCPSRYQNGLEAITDLYLLSECDKLVFSSKSSFGYVSSLLSKAKSQNVYDVEIDDSLLVRLQRKLKSMSKHRIRL